MERMKTKEKTENEILGAITNFYSVKRNGILVDTEKRTLEFYPAGYTKPTSTGTARQTYYHQIYKAAIIKATENNHLPFGNASHNIRIVHQPINQYDSNALQVLLEVKDIEGLQGTIDLGFVPKKINTGLLGNLSQIKEGKIFKVGKKVNDKFYAAKVILFYSKNGYLDHLTPTSKRFRRLMRK